MVAEVDQVEADPLAVVAAVGLAVAAQHFVRATAHGLGEGPRAQDVVAVEAGRDVLVVAADDQVVAAVAPQQVAADAAVDDVVAVAAVGEGIGVALAEDEVVARLAGELVDADAAVQDVVALAADHLVDAGRGDGGLLAAHIVVAGAAIQQVAAVAAEDAVVAVAAVEAVDAVAAVEDVVAAFAVDGVVAAPGVDQVVALAGDDHLVRLGAAVRRAVEIQAAVAGAGARGRRTVLDAQVADVLHAVDGDDGAVAGGGIALGGVDAEGRVGLQRVGVLVLGPGVGDLVLRQVVVLVGIGEHAAVEVLGTGIALDDVLELFVDDALAHLQLVEAIQVVEAVAVHQAAYLVGEHRVEGFAEQAAGDVHFGQAAEPGVDVLEAVHAIERGIGVLQEVQRLLVGVAERGGVALGDAAVLQADQRARALDVAVERVGGDEVHQVVRVDHVGAEVGPAGVFAQADGLAEFVQRGDADVAATGDVDRRQVQRHAQQALVQRRGDEFVDLVGLLVGHAQGDGGRALLREQLGGEEGALQRHAHHRAGDVAGGVDQVDRLAQRAVAEAVGHLREVQADVGLLAAVVADELGDVRRDGAGELVHRGVLVFHLDGDLGSVEQPGLVPGDGAVGVEVVAVGVLAGGGQLPLVEQVVVVGAVLVEPLLAQVLGGDGFLDVAHLEVVLFVPDVVYRGQADVLVHPPVAGDVVVAHRGQQQVADRLAHRRVDGDHAGAGLHAGFDAEVGEVHPQRQRAGAGHRHGRRARAEHAGGHRQLQDAVIRAATVDVGEVVAGAERLGRCLEGGDVGVEGRGGFRVQRVLEMRLVEARVHVEDQRLTGTARLRAGGHVAIGIAVAQVGHVLPGQVGAAGGEQVRAQFVQCRQGGVGRLAEGVLPGHRGVAVQHVGAGMVGNAAIGRHPFAQQVGHFLVGAVGLALVDVGRGVVDPLRRAVGGIAADVGARNHDLGGRLAGGGVDHAVQRIVRGQVDGDLGAVAALADEVEAVVEELAEQHEPAVDRRHAGVLRADEELVVGGSVGVDRVLGVLLAEGLQQAVVGDLGEAVGVLDQVGAAGFALEGHAGRGGQLADHARRVVHHVLHRRCLVDLRRGEVVAALGVVRRDRVRTGGELQRVERVRVAGIQRLDVLVEHHLRALQERLIDSAPGGVHQIEVVVQAGRIAQTLGGGDRGVGLAVRREVRRGAALIRIEHALVVVDRPAAIPGDDGVAIRIEQRPEIDLIPHEVQIGKIEAERLQNITCGHDMFPDA